jgi:hypothetical protein
MSTTTLADRPDDFEGRKIREAKVSSIAMYEAFKYGTVAVAVVGGLTALATWKNKNFARFMSVSAKTSLPVMAGLGMFSYRYESVQGDAMIHPEKWNLEESTAVVKADSKMPMHHKVLNYLYDHPFYFVGLTGLPFAGYVLSTQIARPHLTISQQIMQSRVMAQMGVLSILLSTMAFTSYMDKYGRFPEPGERRVPTFEPVEMETVDYTDKNLHVKRERGN